MTAPSTQHLSDILYRLKNPTGQVSKDYADAIEEIETLRYIVNSAHYFCFVDSSNIEALKQCFTSSDTPKRA